MTENIDTKNKIVFATNNEHKVQEVREIFKDTNFSICSLKDLGLNISADETGKTFLKNSYIKAKAVWDKVGGYVMADDSGLVIDYLPTLLGVKSARFMGHDTDYSIKNNEILKLMKNAKGKERSARFKAAIVLIKPDGEKITATGTMEGQIAESIEGDNGFGYDPIFFLPEYNCTAAVLSSEEKNKISHRGKSLKKLKELLK